MKYKALLFDLDGTLVETVGLYSKAVLGAFREHGYDLSEERFRELYAGGGHIDEWFSTLSGTTVPETLKPRRDEMYMELLGAHAEYLEGAPDLLAHTENMPRAIVTGSWEKYVDAIHGNIGIRDHFRHIICCDDMGMGRFMKPHPHGLLVACDRLGIDPKDSLMIGDQTFDIDAAKAAGMESCLVWSSHTPKHAAGRATHEVGSLKELVKLLG